jgi:hypothetical protein
MKYAVFPLQFFSLVAHIGRFSGIKLRVQQAGAYNHFDRRGEGVGVAEKRFCV